MLTRGSFPAGKPVAAALAAQFFVAVLLGSCAISSIGLRATETFLGEEDPALAAEALPSYIKAAEILSATFPKDRDYALAAAGLELLYASAFLAPRAERLPDSAWAERETLLARAGILFERGARRAKAVLEARVRGLGAALASGDAAPLKRLGRRDLSALYYAAAGGLGALSLNPFDPERSANLSPALAMLERALQLDPAWDSGALQILLVQVAPSIPKESGGGFDRAEAAWLAALEAAGGRRAGHYVAWAKAVCVPRGDVEGFKSACEAALAVDPLIDPGAVLANTLARNEAATLLASIEDIFLIF